MGVDWGTNGKIIDVYETGWLLGRKKFEKWPIFNQKYGPKGKNLKLKYWIFCDLAWVHKYPQNVAPIWLCLDLQKFIFAISKFLQAWAIL